MVARAVVGDTVRVAGTLESGREAWAHRRWGAAVVALGAADGAAPLAVDDLERLAIALFLTGAEGDSTEAWARAYHACIAEDDVARAARCAFWLGFALDITGTDAPAAGWYERARRLVVDAGLDCVERGYVQVPGALATLMVDGGRGGGPPRVRRHRRHRRAVPRRRPGDARPARPRPCARAAGPAAAGAGDAGRGHGGGDPRRGVAGAGGPVVLRGHRDLPGDLRPAPGTGVDRRAHRVVRGPARPRAVPGPLPRAPGRGPAARRRLGRGDGRGAPSRRPAVAATGTHGRRAGLLPARRAAPPARRAGRGRGRLPPGQPLGARAPARPGPAAARPGPRPGRGGGAGPRPGRGGRTAGAARACCRRRSRSPSRSAIVTGARAAADELVAIAAGRGRALAAGRRRPCRRGCRRRRGRPHRCADPPARRAGRLAGDRRAVRVRPDPGAGRRGLPRPRRRRRRRARAGRGAGRLRAARRGAGRGARPGAGRPPGRRGRGGADRSGAPGARPGGDRPHEPGGGRPSCTSATRPWPGT